MELDCGSCGKGIYKPGPEIPPRRTQLGCAFVAGLMTFGFGLLVMAGLAVQGLGWR